MFETAFDSVLVTFYIFMFGVLMFNGLFRKSSSNRKETQLETQTGMGEIPDEGREEAVSEDDGGQRIEARNRSNNEHSNRSVQARPIVDIVREELEAFIANRTYFGGPYASRIAAHIDAGWLAGKISRRVSEQLAQMEYSRIGVLQDRIDELEMQLATYKIMDEDDLAIAVDYAHDVIKWLLQTKLDEPRVEFKDSDLGDVEDATLVVEERDGKKILFLRK